MKSHLIVSLLLISSQAFCQSSFQFNVFSRYDKHAEYTSRYFSRSFTDDILLSGISFGSDINYHKPIFKNVNAIVGIGYYRLRMNYVTSTNFRGKHEGRNIDARVIPSDPLLGTNKYYYDNLNLMGGISYNKSITKSIKATLRTDINIPYTFSQQYNVPWGEDLKYNTSNSRILGFGVNFYTGFSKDVLNKKYYINPQLIIPVFQRIKGDRVFGEDESMKLEKWFNGCGLSIGIGKYI